jgi:hypothetical protein
LVALFVRAALSQTLPVHTTVPYLRFQAIARKGKQTVRKKLGIETSFMETTKIIFSILAGEYVVRVF